MPGHGPRSRAARGSVLLAALGLLLGGCAPTTSPSPTPPVTVTATPAPTPSPAPTTPTPTPAPSPPPTVVAMAPGEVHVFAAPGDVEPVRLVTPAEVVSVEQVPLTFEVLRQDGDWLEVLLPVPPQGSSGWVRAADVTLSTTDLRLTVVLGEHRLVLERGAEVLLDVAVGLGGPGVPAPGHYFVTELLQPPTQGGLYGAYAYGLSGYPPVLRAFAAGTDAVAIHGTGDPATLGTDGPTGGVRVLDADLTRLVEEFGLPLGTPVDVEP